MSDMIKFYSGTPGSGKSLHCAIDIIDCSKAGKPVIGNFACDLSRYPKANFTYVQEDQLTPEFLIQFSRKWFGGRQLTKRDEGSILLVIDECQLIFNSRDWQKKDRKQWLQFFTLHRHFGYDIILIAQMDKMIDRQIRGVIEYEYIHRKLSNFGKAGKLLTVALAGEMFTAVQMWYPLKLKIGSSMFRAKKRYFSIYDSYSSFALDDSGDPDADLVTVSDQTDLVPAQAVPVIPIHARLLDAACRKILSIGYQGKHANENYHLVSR